MTRLIEHPVEELLSRLQINVPRVIIGLAGLPGGGKSTLAHRLCDEVNAQAGPGAMAVLGMDGFHLTRAQLLQMPDPDAALARRGAPWTFDSSALASRLRALREAREVVSWPDFQHEVGDPVEDAHRVAPDVRLVLVEGLYLLHDADGWAEVGRGFDEIWYLDTPLDVALGRLARRHMSAWGMTRQEAEARIAANDRLNAEIVAASRFRADAWLQPLLRQA